MYICIQNNGEVDMRSFYVIGISTKDCSNNKVSQFGTESNYTIATLLRNGHEVIGLYQYNLKFNSKIDDILL